MFRTNEIFSKMWDSVFVDGQERGDLDSFIDALPQQMVEPEDDSTSHDVRIEIDESEEGNFAPKMDEKPIDEPLISDYTSKNSCGDQTNMKCMQSGHQGRAHFKQRVGRRTVVRFHV